jgi:hypothetical protein
MLAGCYSTGEGPSPSVTSFYFPVGMAVSPGGTAMYVANSDFDLRFNAGSVAAYDLNRIREDLRWLWSPESVTMVPKDPCLGLGSNTTPILQPGACGPYNPEAPFGGATTVKRWAKIGAFATDLLFVCPPAVGGLSGGADCTDAGSVDLSMPGTPVLDGGGAPLKARLFAPVRGEPSLTFFDVDDDRAPAAGGPPNQNFLLNCDQAGNDDRCADTHRAGVNAGDNVRALTLPAEPFGIAVTDRAEAIVVSHQASGAGTLSLFTAPDSSPNSTGVSVMGQKPALQFVYGGLPAATTGIAALPVPETATVNPAPGVPDYHQGFVVTYREAAEADVFRFFDDAAAAPMRPFLTRTTAVPLASTPNGRDSRGVAIDHSPTSERVACATACTATNTTCLDGCSKIPLPVYIANRAPPSLLIGEVRLADPKLGTEEVHIYDSVPVAPGPSRVVIGRIKTGTKADGTTPNYEKRVFIICFDARVIFVYDPVERRVDGTIRTGRGPHSLVMDPVAPIAYVGHFTDSYIGLIDLDQSHAGTFESIVATIGVPQPPSATN